MKMFVKFHYAADALRVFEEMSTHMSDKKGSNGP
jgi:hypothetical protein